MTADPSAIGDRSTARPYWARYDASENGPSDELLELICSCGLVDSAISTLRILVDEAHVAADVWSSAFGTLLLLTEEASRLEELVRCFNER